MQPAACSLPAAAWTTLVAKETALLTIQHTLLPVSRPLPYKACPVDWLLTDMFIVLIFSSHIGNGLCHRVAISFLSCHRT